MNDALEWVTAELVTPPGRTSPPALLFLIRQYAAHGLPEVQAALERGLTAALSLFEAERDAGSRVQWMLVFAEATAVADDDRLAATVQHWLPSVIDGLETFVRQVYEPGEGLTGASADVHVRSASALLDAFELTGRLPYPMLAEELVQSSRRQWLAAGAASDGFATQCAAVRVCCRLAALHRDPDYAASAVVARAPTYHEDAEQMLAILEPIYRDHAASAADYGLALLDWFALRQLPN